MINFHTFWSLSLIHVIVSGICGFSHASSQMKASSYDVNSALDVVMAQTEHMRYLPYLNDEGRRVAVVNAFSASPDLTELAIQEAHEYGFDSNVTSLRARFACQPFQRPAQRPTSVHQLTPADIDVVGALGDSLTAGTGIRAKTILGILFQYRGNVFSMGGDEKLDTNPTLVNILRRYNPNVRGFSIGKSTSDNIPKAMFNLAVPSTKSTDLMTQAIEMVRRMKSELSATEFEQSWKMVTIFMGHNDIGNSCEPQYLGVFTAEKYRQRITEVLDYLRAQLPRTLVNLVSIMDVFLANDLNIGVTCKIVHLFEAHCATYPKDRNVVMKLTNDFQQTLEDIVNSGLYKDNKNFAVVVQPFFKNTILPLTPKGKIDLSYFAPDCFHLSQKGHNAAALALWNSLFQEVGKKATSWYPDEDYYCPHKLEIIRT